MYVNCKYVVQFRNKINPCKGLDLQQCVLRIKKNILILYNSFIESMIRKSVQIRTLKPKMYGFDPYIRTMYGPDIPYIVATLLNCVMNTFLI